MESYKYGLGDGLLSLNVKLSRSIRIVVWSFLPESYSAD